MFVATEFRSLHLLGALIQSFVSQIHGDVKIIKKQIKLVESVYKTWQDFGKKHSLSIFAPPILGDVKESRGKQIYWIDTETYVRYRQVLFVLRMVSHGPLTPT